MVWRRLGLQLARRKTEVWMEDECIIASVLIGGTRAPFFRLERVVVTRRRPDHTGRRGWPSVDELFVGMFSVTRDIDLPIA